MQMGLFFFSSVFPKKQEDVKVQTSDVEPREFYLICEKLQRAQRSLRWGGDNNMVKGPVGGTEMMLMLLIRVLTPSPSLAFSIYPVRTALH